MRTTHRRYDLPGWPPAHDLRSVVAAELDQFSADANAGDDREIVHDFGDLHEAAYAENHAHKLADHGDRVAAGADDDMDEVAF